MNHPSNAYTGKLRFFTLTLTLLAAFFFSFFLKLPNSTVLAAANEYKFDFGNGGTQDGFIGVNASTSYNSSTGYGFNSTGNMKDVAANGSGELSDAVQFTSTDTSNTFNVDLDNGLYEITVYLGNTTRTSIWAEGCLQIINMTGDNAVHTIKLPITDGQLNIMATAGKAGYAFTMSALLIKKISDNPELPPTIWFCGDSTVCNYYPLDTSTQAGWGQVFSTYIDNSYWDVRNLAASGQYAKGFVDAGQFEPILKYGKAGDVYIISIGINDTNYSNADEYKETVTYMAKEAMAKGMNVILVKQQGRADDISRTTLLTGRWFSSKLDEIGSELNIQVLDLFNLAQDYYLSIGQDATYQLYMDGDTLHPNRAGANVLAKLAASNITLIPSDNNDNDDNNNNDNNDNSDNTNTRFYAIDASVEKGIEEDYNLGYYGSAYINLDNEIGSAITWHVRAEETANYFVSFRIANGSATDRAMKVEVNEGSDYWIQPFLTTGSYTTWQERGIVLPLKAGVNKIKLTSTISEGGPNFDFLTITKTDEPIAEVYQEPENNDQPTDTTTTRTIYIAGDSTAQSYRASYAPQQGWGYYLADYLTNSNLTVSNQAIAGRSSKKFYDDGRLTTILDSIQSGDFFLIQFGINDSASSIAERYAPTCGSVENATEGSFEYYIKMYVQGALDKGATPIVMSPTLGLKAYSNNQFVNSYSNYGDAMKSIADYYNIPYIDLNSLMVEDYNRIGYDAALLYHLAGVVEGSTDMTHFCEAGAQNAAKLICSKLNDIISQYPSASSLNNLSAALPSAQTTKTAAIQTQTTKLSYKTGDQVTDTVSNAVYQITKNTKKTKTVTYVKPVKQQKTVSIPASIQLNGKTYKVTAIGKKAFYQNKKLKKVTISSSVKQIGKSAFSGCKNLTQVSIQSTTLTKQSIGTNAFKGISKKVKFTIPTKKHSAYCEFLPLK